MHVFACFKISHIEFLFTNNYVYKITKTADICKTLKFALLCFIMTVFIYAKSKERTNYTQNTYKHFSMPWYRIYGIYNTYI